MADPGVPVDGMPGYSWSTWRDAINDAQQGIDTARDRRKRVFQAAFDSGLTLAQIAEAAGMSTAGVHKIIGRQKGASLDGPAFDSNCRL